VALNPLRYEALRDAQRLADEKERERQDSAEHRSRDAAKSEKPSPELDRETIQKQARSQVDLENAVRFERQKDAYDQRQREEAAKNEREARRSEYMKTHDPVEYAREQKDNARRQEWGRDRNQVASEQEREKSDGAQAREPGKWANGQSERARALVEETRERDAREREDDRDRSER
jgi:hypothetical protein